MDIIKSQAFNVRQLRLYVSDLVKQYIYERFSVWETFQNLFQDVVRLLTGVLMLSTTVINQSGLSCSYQ